VEKRLEGWRFGLGFRGRKGEGEYGVVVVGRDGDEEKCGDLSGRSRGGVARIGWTQRALGKMFGFRHPAVRGLIRRFKSGYSRIPEGKIFEWCGLLYMAGLIILVTYYTAVQGPDTAFERFMDGQAFGVRVLFTAFGVVLTFFWNWYYASESTFYSSPSPSNIHQFHSRILLTFTIGVTTLQPYRQLHTPNGGTLSTLLATPPTTVFTALPSILFLRQGIFPSVVALCDILARFTPILLSNIPFSPVQTWQLHIICAWTTVGSLVFMGLVLAYASFMVEYPDMPISPASLAGRLYYLCDSDEVVKEFSGLGTCNLKTWKGMGKVDSKRRYRFGQMVGDSAKKRVGVFAIGDQP